MAKPYIPNQNSIFWQNLCFSLLKFNLLTKPFYFMIKLLPLSKIYLLHAGLSLRPCICHDMTNAFRCRHNLASNQPMVNVGQNEVGLPKIQLGAIENLVIPSP